MLELEAGKGVREGGKGGGRGGGAGGGGEGERGGGQVLGAKSRKFAKGARRRNSPPAASTPLRAGSASSMKNKMRAPPPSCGLSVRVFFEV